MSPSRGVDVEVTEEVGGEDTLSPSRGVEVEVTEEGGGEDTLSPSRGVEVEVTEEEGGEDTLHNYIRKRSIHRVTSLTLFLLYIFLRGHIHFPFSNQITSYYCK